MIEPNFFNLGSSVMCGKLAMPSRWESIIFIFTEKPLCILKFLNLKGIEVTCQTPTLCYPFLSIHRQIRLIARINRLAEFSDANDCFDR